MWRDPDEVPFAPAPPEYISPMVWDVGDQSVFYPLARAFALDLMDAANANTFHARLEEIHAAAA